MERLVGFIIILFLFIFIIADVSVFIENQIQNIQRTIIVYNIIDIHKMCYLFDFHRPTS